MQCVCPSQDCSETECVELTNREFAVCEVICSSGEPVSFTLLKERTQLHQEIVSRVVRRLTVHGLVSKVDGKYQGSCASRRLAIND